MVEPASEEFLSNISDTSFVILGPGSLPNQETDEPLSQNSNEDSTKPCDDEKCFSKCSCPDEGIQQKLNELLKENDNLKETLNHNNLAIKSQLNTFIMWQRDVLKAQETHKKKFLETKDLILKLQMENLNLKKQMQESSQRFDAISIGDIDVDVINKLSDSDELKERLKEYEYICGELVSKSMNLNTENQELVKELGDAKNEVLRLKKELEEVKVEKQAEGSKESIPYKLSANAEARAQISKLFIQVEEEKSKVLKLKEASPHTSTTEELSDCISKVNDMNDCVDMQSQRMSSLNSWVTLKEENETKDAVDCNGMCEMKEFISYLNVEENAFKEKKASLAELKEQFTKLLEDYKILQQELSSLKMENQNSKKYKEDIDRLSVDLETKDRELTSKQDECNRLKEELERLNSEWHEKVSLLQIQADVYRNDFNAEREAKELVKREKEEALEEVVLLRNYVEELSKSQGKGIVEDGKKQVSTAKCPRCFISFPTSEDLYDHIQTCMDICMDY